jgi:hypothetical protein
MLTLSVYRPPIDPWDFIEQEVEKYASIAYLPEELLFKIFAYLTPPQLDIVSLVCWKWRRVGCDDRLWRAFDPRVLFSGLYAMERLYWEDFVDVALLGLEFENKRQEEDFQCLRRRNLAYYKPGRGGVHHGVISLWLSS